ncbi:MAG: SCP2 sterol-binding domain-containing protein [Myxococcota bacterium]|nr:SCP2 sterol-binding domain-containing protein [Myxococcota bacterium]
MAEFPTAPLSPAEFLEDWFPRAFAAADMPDQVKAVELLLGVKLEGDGGGEWLFQMQGGDVVVRAEPRTEAAFTVVQSVADWRGALWEGRGGAIGRTAAKVFRPAELRAGGDAAAGLAAPGPAALAKMRSLDGLVRMVVSGAEGGDWGVGFKLGPGEIPPAANTTVTVTAEDASAMERGEFNPLEAFMAGRIQVDGDVGLLMQMQAAIFS